MASDRKTGAGSRLSGVLERQAPPSPVEPDEPDAGTEPEPAAELSPATPRGRGVVPRRSRAVDSRAAKKIKGRTVYIPDDLFERILVQAHRKDKTISEYVVAILERQVPDYRGARVAESVDSRDDEAA